MPGEHAAAVRPEHIQTRLRDLHDAQSGLERTAAQQHEHEHELLTLLSVVFECGNVILDAASPLGLRGHNYPLNHGLDGTRLSPAELTLSGSRIGIQTARVIEAMTLVVAEIERERVALREKEVGDE